MRPSLSGWVVPSTCSKSTPTPPTSATTMSRGATSGPIRDGIRRPPEPASTSASTISSTSVPSVVPSSTQHLPYQPNDGIRSGQIVSRAEPKQRKASLHHAILAAIIGRQALAMSRAVVLDRQPLWRVIEVRPANESATVVVKRNLGLWPGQPGQDQKQAQLRFHDTLSGRLGQLDCPPQTRRAPEPLVRIQPLLEMASLEKPP